MGKTLCVFCMVGCIFLRPDVSFSGEKIISVQERISKYKSESLPFTKDQQSSPPTIESLLGTWKYYSGSLIELVQIFGGVEALIHFGPAPRGLEPQATLNRVYQEWLATSSRDIQQLKQQLNFYLPNKKFLNGHTLHRLNNRCGLTGFQINDIPFVESLKDHPIFKKFESLLVPYEIHLFHNNTYDIFGVLLIEKKTRKIKVATLTSYTLEPKDAATVTLSARPPLLDFHFFLNEMAKRGQCPSVTKTINTEGDPEWVEFTGIQQ